MLRNKVQDTAPEFPLWHQLSSSAARSQEETREGVEGGGAVAANKSKNKLSNLCAPGRPNLRQQNLANPTSRRGEGGWALIRGGRWETGNFCGTCHRFARGKANVRSSSMRACWACMFALDWGCPHGCRQEVLVEAVFFQQHILPTIGHQRPSPKPQTVCCMSLCRTKS